MYHPNQSFVQPLPNQTTTTQLQQSQNDLTSIALKMYHPNQNFDFNFQQLPNPQSPPPMQQSFVNPQTTTATQIQQSQPTQSFDLNFQQLPSPVQTVATSSQIQQPQPPQPKQMVASFLPGHQQIAPAGSQIFGNAIVQNPENQNKILDVNGQWQKALDDIHKNPNFKTHELPLARIKKIMKLDEEVQMISAEAPVVFSKACELFIIELTTRSWYHTNEAKRRTLQRSDISMAISSNDVFDFLIDIVPREEPLKNKSLKK